MRHTTIQNKTRIWFNHCYQRHLTTTLVQSRSRLLMTKHA